MADGSVDLRIAVLSDTHGLLRPEVLEAVRGADWIFHAGDLGSGEGGRGVLEALRAVAPVVAVRGNVDGEELGLAATEMVEVGGVWFYLLHDIAELDIDPAAAGVRAVISGHSHVPKRTERNGVMYLNPGSVGPRRFKLPIAMAFLTVRGGVFSVEMVEV